MSETVDRDAVEAWCKALESGDYPQGDGTLVLSTRQPDGTVTRKFCCLGVACEIDPETRGKYRDSYEDGRESYGRYGRSVDLMPIELAKRWGLEISPRSSDDPDEVGVVICDSHEDYDNLPLAASDANDELRLSFGEIAALIREKYLRD